MKTCKILKINDGKVKILKNEDYMFIQEMCRAEKIIETYINDGYEVKQIFSTYDPAIQEEGSYTFYKGGVIVYLEKEV